MSAITHLRALQALHLAVRTGSLKAAAEELAITPAAAGQRVKTLEDFLGVDLLVRGRSGLQPTPALQAALEHLDSGFRELTAAAAVLDLQRGQEIHIAAPGDVVELWLKPRLGAFRETQPNTSFCINGEGDAPIRVGQTDCEIGFGAVRAGADVLFRDFVAPVGSTETKARQKGLPKRERLEGFPLLHLDFYRDDPAGISWPEWIKRQRLHRTGPNRGVRFRSIAAALEAVRADAGFALCGLALAKPLLDEGEIVLLFPVSAGVWTEHAFWARFRDASLARPQVRKFQQWLLAEAGATRAWLEQTSKPGGAKRTKKR